MENRPVVCVIAGTRASAAHLFRAKNAVALHLHFHVDLQDFTPKQLVAICKRFAAEEKRCTFAPGLAEQVSLQWKNPDFLLKNPDFLLKTVDFLLKNVVFIL